MAHLTGTITVRGNDYTVTHNPEWGSGEFIADVEGKRVRAANWTALVSAVGAELRKRDVSVALRFLDPATRKVGTATKLHAKTRKPLVKWDDGTSSQAEVKDPLEPGTDVVELERLQRARSKATMALSKFMTEHKLKETSPDTKGWEGLQGHLEIALVAKAREVAATEAVAGVEPVELDA